MGGCCAVRAGEAVPEVGESAWDWELLRRSCLSEARRVLRDPYEAEEAVQEALTRAWRQRHRCRERHAPNAWLRRIARNEALRLVERKRVHAELTPEAEAAASVGEGPEDAVVERLSVDRALEELSPQERELVSLRYRLDLTQAEIARLLKIPEATVRVRLHRIRKRLHAVMGGRG